MTNISNSFRPMQTPTRYRPLPWQLRLSSWMVIVTQFYYPYAGQVSAQEVRQPVSPNVAAAPGFPAPVLTPANVTVNRTVPRVAPPEKELKFSADPTDQEIFQARV